MLRKRIQITRASALEFRVPGSRGPRTGDPYAFNVVVRLAGTRARQTLEGIGEACPRGRSMTGDSAEGSWRFLEAALEHLEGVRLGTRPQIARADAAEVMRELRVLASDMSASRIVRVPYRGMLAGLDIALIDLAAKGSDASLASILGGKRRTVASTAIVNARAPKHRLRMQVAKRARCSAIKVVDIADRESALDAVALVADVVGSAMPIWLDFNKPLDAPEGVKLVEALAERIMAGEVAANVVVQQPRESHDLAILAEIQTAADTLLPPDRDRPGLVAMGAPESRDDALAIVNSGVRGVDLSVQRLGGTLGVLEVAGELHDRGSDVRIGLSAVPHVGGIAARALVELAGALPRADYCAISPSAVSGPVATAPRIKYDRKHRLRTGDGPGIGIGLDLAPAVHYLSRHAEAPRVAPAPLMYEGQPANKFDLDDFMVFANARGGINLAGVMRDRAAMIYGLDTTRYTDGLQLIHHRQLPEPIGFAGCRSAGTGVPARTVTNRKDLTKKFLREANVATPYGEVFEPGEVEAAVQFASSLNVPAVVKPQSGAHGASVFTDLHSAADVRNAVTALKASNFGSHPFVVEEFVPGNDYRFFVVADRVVSVVLRRPASVVGDGRSTVVDLVLAKNRRRLEVPQMRSGLIRLQDDAEYWLSKQNLTVESVPEQGRVVRLGSPGNPANGGDSIEVLDEAHESLLALAVRATQAIPGLDHAGVDIIGDHQRGLGDARAVVIEVNANPSIDLNHFPLFGPPRDVASDLIVRECQLAGFCPDGPLETLSIRIRVEGRVQGVGYRRWFERLAVERGVRGATRNLATGGVEAEVTGFAENVWVLAAAAAVGPRRAVVDRVITTHIAGVEPFDRFEVQ